MADPFVIPFTLDSDADFILRGIYIVPLLQFTTFQWNYSGPSGYFYSQNLLPCQSFSYNASQPTPVLPEVLYPAGSVIRINIQNTSNVTTYPPPLLFYIVFCGVKRFATDCSDTDDRMFLYPLRFQITSTGGGGSKV